MDDPITLFRSLLAAARQVDRALLPEPTAFALATVGADGRPSVRTVLLKDVDERGFVFYTNYESQKGRQLGANPWAAICFHWQPLELQVRAEGRAEPVSAEEADAYFASRARGSQLGAWASQQSRVIDPPGALEARLADFERKFADGPVPRPAHWSGYRLAPDRIEFWKGKPNRLHERHLYTRQGSAWKVQTLYP
jgi:pyridoxamine 5'-phosphate oxidase